MEEHYKASMKVKAKKQRTLNFLGLGIIIGVYVLISLGLILWYRTLPYLSDTITTIKIIHYVFSAIWVIILIIFCQIKLKRINKYYKKCIDLEVGLTETYVGSFVEYCEKQESKDGVDFKSIIFLEYNKKKKDYFERKVLVFYEEEFPKFEVGQNVKYVTQGNVLKYYERLEQGE